MTRYTFICTLVLSILAVRSHAVVPLSFPTTVQLIKTTGVEEGNAAYTRGTAIVISKVELSKTQSELEKIICHELFHILSRHNPKLRERLYAIIGFIPCDDVEFPR